MKKKERQDAWSKYYGTIEKQFQQMKDELSAEVSRTYERECEEYRKINEAPCPVCGKKEFVQKFRDVQGKIKGSISGSYSLFGGSISGYVDGSISTMPVLSCRSCQNERQIEVQEYPDRNDIYESNIPYYIECDPKYPGEYIGELTDWGKKFCIQAHLMFCRDTHPKIRNLTYYEGFEYPDEYYRKAGFTVLEKPKRTGLFAWLFN